MPKRLKLVPEVTTTTEIKPSGIVNDKKQKEKPAANQFFRSLLRIRVSPVAIAPNRIISIPKYDSQFPGPLIRLREGQPVTVDVYNDTDVREQLQWQRQMLSADVPLAA